MVFDFTEFLICIAVPAGLGVLVTVPLALKVKVKLVPVMEIPPAAGKGVVAEPILGVTREKVTAGGTSLNI